MSFPPEPRKRRGGVEQPRRSVPSRQKLNLAIEPGAEIQFSEKFIDEESSMKPKESFDTSSDSQNIRKKRNRPTKRERMNKPLPQPEIPGYEEGNTIPAPQLLLGEDSESINSSPKLKRSKRSIKDKKRKGTRKGAKLDQIPKKNISSQDLLLCKKPKKSRTKTPQAKSPSKLLKSEKQINPDMKNSSTGKENYMVAILPTPDENSDDVDFSPRRYSKLPVPRFPKGSERGDGLMPLETLAETTEVFTNAFRTDLYEGVKARRKATAPERDLSRPIPNWFQFQVPIPTQCGISEEERLASREYDINRLLHAVKVSAM